MSRVLRGALLMRMLRIERAFAEARHGVPIHHCGKLVVLHAVDLLQPHGDVRKPSKKCRKGTLAFSVATWATSAMSITSCTELAQSIAKPVCRAGHHVGMVAEDVQRVRKPARARTRGTRTGSSSPEILYMFGIISSKALGSGERRGEGARGQRAVHSARGARFRLHLRDAELSARKGSSAQRQPTRRQIRPSEKTA